MCGAIPPLLLRLHGVTLHYTPLPLRISNAIFTLMCMRQRKLQALIYLVLSKVLQRPGVSGKNLNCSWTSKDSCPSVAQTSSSLLCSLLHYRYLVPLGPKYPPQHPILENPQPTFLPQCEHSLLSTHS